MDDELFLKYNFSRLLNSINFSKGHPWKTKIYENVVMRCICIQDTLSSRAALGLPASASREQRYLAYKRCIQDALSSRTALGLWPSAFRPSASREQRYIAYKVMRVPRLLPYKLFLARYK